MSKFPEGKQCFIIFFFLSKYILHTDTVEQSLLEGKVNEKLGNIFADLFW